MANDFVGRIANPQSQNTISRRHWMYSLRKQQVASTPLNRNATLNPLYNRQVDCFGRWYPCRNIFSSIPWMKQHSGSVRYRT